MTRFTRIALMVFGAVLGIAAQTATPTIVVHPFTAKAGLSWPYDFGVLQKETIAKLKDKLGESAQVLGAAPPAAGAYALQGEVERMYQSNNLDAHSGGLASNQEVITIRYWLSDATGKKIFDRTTTYESAVPAYESSTNYSGAGPMARDLESDIAGRVKGAKIYPGK